MRKNGVMTCLFMGLLLFGSSCAGRRSEERTPVQVRLFEVQDAGAATSQDFPGRVMAAEEVNMAFKVGGTLMNLYVEDGSRVRKGQLVAEMDPRDYQVQLEAAEAEYMQVRAEAGRVIALYADSVSTADAYDKARYGLRQVTAKYEHAKNQLADTRIYAPFDGYVQKTLFDPPTVVAAGMPVATVVSEGSPEIEINIPASAYMRRKEIVSFGASFDFIPGQTVPLRLISMAPKANANQLYAVRLAVPREMSPQPAPGMNAMVHMETSGTADGSARVPSSALFEQAGQSCVWIYDEQSGTVGRRTVTVGQLHTDGTATLTSGLSGGELVVSAGVHKLTDGQQVRPMQGESETNAGGLL